MTIHRNKVSVRTIQLSVFLRLSEVVQIDILTFQEIQRLNIINGTSNDMKLILI